MTYSLDAAFGKAVDDASVKVIVLRANGKHFSAGHDIGTPGTRLRHLLRQRGHAVRITPISKALISGWHGRSRCTWGCAGAGATSPNR